MVITNRGTAPATANGPESIPISPNDGLHATADPYLLRGLIWCRFCGQPMRPRLGHNGRLRRRYTCPTRCSQRQTAGVNAEAVERTILTEVAGRVPGWQHIDEPYQAAALTTLLARITVGATENDVSFSWRSLN